MRLCWLAAVQGFLGAYASSQLLLLERRRPNSTASAELWSDAAPKLRSSSRNATRLRRLLDGDRLLYDGECWCGWKDEGDRGCGSDDKSTCWDQCCGWECTCEWAEVTCGIDDGTACWRHCCGGPDCDCTWAQEEGCGESDNSPCWHHCCDVLAGATPAPPPEAADWQPPEALLPPPAAPAPPASRSGPSEEAGPGEPGSGGVDSGCDCRCAEVRAGHPSNCLGHLSVSCQHECAKKAEAPHEAAEVVGPWFTPWRESQGVPIPPMAGAFFNNTLWDRVATVEPGSSSTTSSTARSNDEHLSGSVNGEQQSGAPASGQRPGSPGSGEELARPGIDGHLSGAAPSGDGQLSGSADGEQQSGAPDRGERPGSPGSGEHLAMPGIDGHLSGAARSGDGQLSGSVDGEQQSGALGSGQRPDSPGSGEELARPGIDGHLSGAARSGDGQSSGSVDGEQQSGAPGSGQWPDTPGSGEQLPGPGIDGHLSGAARSGDGQLSGSVDGEQLSGAPGSGQRPGSPGSGEEFARPGIDGHLSGVSDGELPGATGDLEGLGRSWNGSVVPFCFAPDVSSNTQQAVHAATRRFSMLVPCITFREVPLRPRRQMGELYQCVQAPAVLITSRCILPEDCKCGPLPDRPAAIGMRVLNLVDPDCLPRSVIVHELGHIIGTPWQQIEGVHEAEDSHFVKKLVAPSSIFPHKAAGIQSGLSKFVWDWVWTPAALNSLDISQLKQMYELMPAGSHPPLQGGPRCLDTPRAGVDVCSQLSDADCEALGDVQARCCVCGGGLRIQCPFGSPPGPGPGPEHLAAQEDGVSDLAAEFSWTGLIAMSPPLVVSSTSVAALVALSAQAARRGCSTRRWHSSESGDDACHTSMRLATSEA